MITAKLDDEGAQLYVVMKGSPKTVGKVERYYRPHHLAVRCSLRHKPIVVRFLNELYEKGYWKEMTKEKSSRAVHIRLSEVRHVLDELSKSKTLQ